MYGISARLLAETAFAGYFALVSVTFLIVVPVVIGYLAVFPAPRPSWWYRLFMPWVPVSAGVAASMLAGWEGAICVVMSTPVLLLLSSVGGLAAGFHSAKRTRHAAVVAILPFVLGPVETLLTAPTRVERNVTEIVVNAPASTVWKHVIEVPEISESEWTRALYTTIGFPRPVSATLDREGVGGVRRATFRGGVLFLEEVTHWDVERRIAFTIDAQTASIPPSSLDPHVIIGGKYFDVLDGEYLLEPRSDGTTLVVLSSTHRVSTTLNVYTAWWARVVMQSIQESILEVVKKRAEHDQELAA